MSQQKNVFAIGPRKIIVTVTRVVVYLLYFYIIAVEIILFIGFFLLLFGANPSAGFTEWAYRNLDRVMEPFRGIFTPIELGTTSGNVEAVFETSVVFAMIIYGIVGMVLSAVIPWLSGRLQYLAQAEADAEARAQRQAAIDQLAAETQAAPTTPVPAPTAPPSTTGTMPASTTQPPQPPPPPPQQP